MIFVVRRSKRIYDKAKLYQGIDQVVSFEDIEGVIDSKMTFYQEVINSDLMDLRKA